MDYHPHYAKAAAEVDSGHPVPGLWGMAFSDALGDTQKAKALYISLRAEQLAECLDAPVPLGETAKPIPAEYLKKQEVHPATTLSLMLGIGFFFVALLKIMPPAVGYIVLGSGMFLGIIGLWLSPESRKKIAITALFLNIFWFIFFAFRTYPDPR